MEVSLADDCNSSPSFMYKAAHQAFKDRWKETDDTMCLHSMSFHLHHTLRSEFFASYLYLVEKIPLGKNTVQPHRRGQRLNLSRSLTPLRMTWRNMLQFCSTGQFSLCQHTLLMITRLKYLWNRLHDPNSLHKNSIFSHVQHRLQVLCAFISESSCYTVQKCFKSLWNNIKYQIQHTWQLGWNSLSSLIRNIKGVSECFLIQFNYC